MRRYLKGYRTMAVLAPLMKLFEALLELYVPFFIAGVIDNGIRGGSGAEILKNCGLIALFGLAGMAFSVTSQYFSAKCAVGFASSLREDAFRHVLSLSRTDADKNGNSTLITRLTADIDRIQNGVNMGLRLLLRSPFIVFGSVIMAAAIDPGSGLMFLAVVGVLAVIVFSVILLGIRLQKKAGEKLEDLTRLTRDDLRGVRVIRAFGREEEENRRFGLAENRFSTAFIRGGTLSSFMNPMTFAIVNIAVILIVTRGAGKVNEGSLSQGSVVALYNYMAQILTELVKLANLTLTLSKAAAGISRVRTVLETPAEDLSGDTPDFSSDEVVEFRNVGFRYAGAGADSLSGISFRLGKGESLGIIGGTGSGKSTLVSLMSCLYEPSEGAVLFGGKDSRELSKKEIRANIASVPQYPRLFTGTVSDNLRRANFSASDNDVREALSAADALDFTEKKADGIDCVVQREGSNFSGGQKQRLTIARALLRRPSLLILDDSFSALDYRTDLEVRRNIASLDWPHATVIVSQRPSSVMNCDRILVLDNGRAAGLGSHQELLASCELYREIYFSQYEKEEA